MPVEPKKPEQKKPQPSPTGTGVPKPQRSPMPGRDTEDQPKVARTYQPPPGPDGTPGQQTPMPWGQPPQSPSTPWAQGAPSGGAPQGQPNWAALQQRFAQNPGTTVVPQAPRAFMPGQQGGGESPWLQQALQQAAARMAAMRQGGMPRQGPPMPQGPAVAPGGPVQLDPRIMAMLAQRRGM